LDLPLRTPQAGADIEEEGAKNMDDLPSDSVEETTQQGEDEKEAITQIKI
jgi:hypothetical protein